MPQAKRQLKSNLLVKLGIRASLAEIAVHADPTMSHLRLAQPDIVHFEALLLEDVSGNRAQSD